MTRLRPLLMLVALLLAAVAAPIGGVAVRSAAHADSPAPTGVPAPSVPPDSSDVGTAIVATMDDDEDDDAPQTIPADELLAPDGTLRLDGAVTGTVDLSGWHVTLDPELGPVFHPQSFTWEHLGTRPGTLNGTVHAVAVSGSDVYVGGGFTDAGGNPNADYIARWDGSAWQALGNGLNDGVFAVAVSGSNVYVGGGFTDAGGNPNADYIARWDGSAWQALGNGLNNWVEAIAVSGSDVYVGGVFTNAGGNPNADRIARWNGSAWQALGSGLNVAVLAVAVSVSDVYVGGGFTDAGGNVNADFIARSPLVKKVYLPLITR